MSERVVPERTIPEHIVVEITLTPEEYAKLKNDALWGGNSNVSAYIKDMAMGRQRRGC